MTKLPFIYYYCRVPAVLSVSILVVSLLALPVFAADMSGWSDKSVCRLVTEKA
ncbi:MAG: hypothetical protein ACI9S7_002031, partial [Candidatus Paceibacteria bacterium]